MSQILFQNCKCIISFVQSKVLLFAFGLRILHVKWSGVASIIIHYFKFELDPVRIGFGQTRIRVGLGLGHSRSSWISSGMDWFGSFRVRTTSNQSDFGSVQTQFGPFRVSGQYSFELVHFWVDSILSFGSVQLFWISVQVWFQVVWFGSFRSGQFC